MNTMQISVKHQGYELVMTEDGEFKCPHYNAEVEPPCCGGGAYIACGCQGVYSVSCPDCQNDDMLDWEKDNIIEAYIGNMEDRYDD